MVNIPAFFESGPASDPAYVAVRDAPDLADVKSFIEQLWADYWPSSDLHFLRESKIQFHQRTWELYLWHVLKMYGHDPQKSGPKGPDMWFNLDHTKIWVEAVAPGQGIGPDAVPSMRTLGEMIDAGEEPVFQDVPEAQILLRFTQAISDKLKKYEDYCSAGIIDPEDGYIIAINGREAMAYRSDIEIPFAIKATMGLGSLAVLFDPDPTKETESHYQRRLQILKTNGSATSTELFLNERYRSVSALLCSDRDIVNVPSQAGPDMYYFHNPLASTPLPSGAFTFCREYRAYMERCRLDHTDWHAKKPVADNRREDTSII